MPPRRSKSTLPVLFSIIVIDLIGFAIIIPVLPFYADAYGADGLILGLLYGVLLGFFAIFKRE